MDDTNKQILNVFSTDDPMSSSEVHGKLGEKVSLVTVKRHLSELVTYGHLISEGAGRSVVYRLSKTGLLLRPIAVEKYLAAPPDERSSSTTYRFDLFEEPYVDLFIEAELSRLSDATEQYRSNATQAGAGIHEKELLRFIVEFSWKTSQIEGNTYDLLSTERLLRYGEKSPTNTEYEAQMIINQKEAIDYILSDRKKWQNPTIHDIEELHQLVGKNLAIQRNLREGLVGITGTNYRPLDNKFQIHEALESLLGWVGTSNNFYEKALLAVLGISYIQPFVDGNKRTARLVGNALLLSNDYAPLSYRSVDDRSYKEATLVFYEQHSLEPFKQLFIEQYVFSAENYNIGQ